jgi:hypothetical protein
MPIMCVRHRKIVGLGGAAVLALAVVAALSLSGAHGGRADRGASESAGDGDALLPVANAEWAAGQPTPIGVPICTTAPSSAANVNTDCEPNEISNGTSLAVNPTNPSKLIGAANEYQLQYTSSGQLGQISDLPRAHVSYFARM